VDRDGLPPHGSGAAARGWSPRGPLRASPRPGGRPRGHARRVRGVCGRTVVRRPHRRAGRAGHGRGAGRPQQPRPAQRDAAGRGPGTGDRHLGGAGFPRRSAHRPPRRRLARRSRVVAGDLPPQHPADPRRRPGAGARPGDRRLAGSARPGRRRCAARRRRSGGVDRRVDHRHEPGMDEPPGRRGPGRGCGVPDRPDTGRATGTGADARAATGMLTGAAAFLWLAFAHGS
jgi:hypothetical protein